jgi:hypothetical protein
VGVVEEWVGFFLGEVFKIVQIGLTLVFSSPWDSHSSSTGTAKIHPLFKFHATWQGQKLKSG